jgi:hypothetical protein
LTTLPISSAADWSAAATTSNVTVSSGLMPGRRR